MNDNEKSYSVSYFEYDYPDAASGGKSKKSGKKRFGWSMVITTGLVCLLIGALAAGLVFMSFGYKLGAAEVQAPQTVATPNPTREGNLPDDIPSATPVPTPKPEDTGERGELPVPTLGNPVKPVIGSEMPVVDINEQVSSSVVTVTSKVEEYSYVTERYLEIDKSIGSGLILTPDGYIVTNNHIIESADSVYVTVSEDEYKADIIGSDASVDLAVLKINAAGLKPAALGDSSTLRVGETAIAIGNALGTLTSSLTQGVISGLNREINTDGRVQTYIQTDAAINPGNSGGPLLDGKGLVIGICSLKIVTASYDEYGNTIAAEGLGYAIPINEVITVVKQLIQFGYVPRPAIGILAYEMTVMDSEEWQMPKGVLVTTVRKTGPSYNKLMEDDIITGYDGVELESFKQLTDAIKAKNVGDTILLEVWREGETLELSVEIGDTNKIEESEQAFNSEQSESDDFGDFDFGW